MLFSFTHSGHVLDSNQISRFDTGTYLGWALNSIRPQSSLPQVHPQKLILGGSLHTMRPLIHEVGRSFIEIPMHSPAFERGWNLGRHACRTLVGMGELND